ncbi:MAG TPA: hypothetical protein VHD90_28540 [Phototrophicaceae bacterium]|nr:hypothetical protein [Phototrophicaceae bacterium]
MDGTPQFKEVLTLALKLSRKERLQLAEQVKSSAEHEIEPESLEPESPPTEHWGKNLLRLLDELGPIEMVHPEITDPVEWVEQIRRDDASARGLDWGEDE